MPLLVGNLSCVHGVRLMFHRPWLGIQIIQFNRNITDQNSPLNFEQEGGEGKPAAMHGKSSDVSVKRKKREGSNELFAQEDLCMQWAKLRRVVRVKALEVCPCWV